MCGRLRPSRIELLDGERFVGVGRKCYLSNKDAVKKKNKRKNMPIKKLSMVEMICFVFFSIPGSINFYNCLIGLLTLTCEVYCVAQRVLYI